MGCVIKGQGTWDVLIVSGSEVAQDVPVVSEAWGCRM